MTNQHPITPPDKQLVRKWIKEAPQGGWLNDGSPEPSAYGKK